jgi:hypothetical protein
MLLLAATWMSLEDIMLSETSQTQTGKYCAISRVRQQHKFQITDTEKRLVTRDGMGERKWRWRSEDTKWQVRKMNKSRDITHSSTTTRNKSALYLAFTEMPDRLLLPLAHKHKKAIL